MSRINPSINVGLEEEDGKLHGILKCPYVGCVWSKKIDISAGNIRYLPLTEHLSGCGKRKLIEMAIAMCDCTPEHTD